jgi:SAM-dependent methyltransferase
VCAVWDYREPSIWYDVYLLPDTRTRPGAASHRGRTRALESGTANARSETATAKGYAAGEGFDLICFMDCLHDLGDPLGALAQARHSLKPQGKVMLVEPYAGDAVEGNLNPVGRLFAPSTSLRARPT